MSQTTADAGAPPPVPPQRQVAACPWCGAGSDLGIVGDGFGAVALACARCGARGPSVRLGEIKASDEAAIRRWSHRHRPTLPAGLIERVRVAIALHRLGGPVSAESDIAVAFRDLDVLMRAASA